MAEQKGRTKMAIDPKRLERFDAARLLHGAHDSIASGGCVMEWAAYLAGKPHTDSPPCVSAPIGAFMRSWNDGLPDAQRQMLKPYAVKVLGTAASKKTEERRSWMAMDWLIREFTPTWLEAAGLNDDAASLRGLPEITDGHGVADVMSVLLPAQKIAAAAWAAAGDAAGAWAAAWAAAGAWDAARDAARAAARDAARAAAGDAAGAWAAAWAAAGNAARDAARAAAWAAARDAAWAAAGAWAAARAAAGAAAGAALAPTVKRLQDSAFTLLDRMIVASTASAPTEPPEPTPDPEAQRG